MANQTGQGCIFARATAGSFSSPTWITIDNVENLKIPDSRTKAPAPTRASKFNKYLVGQIEKSVSFQMPRDIADTDYLAMRTAYLAGTTLPFAHASGVIATTGTRYCKFEAKITKMDEDEPLDAACMVDCELNLAADSTNDPIEATV